MAARDLRVVWGVNRWVLVETRYRSVERQVGTEKELVALLSEIGLLPDDAKAAARDQWKRRPRDAATMTARPGDGLRRATGLTPRSIAITFGVSILLFVVSIIWLLPLLLHR